MRNILGGNTRGVVKTGRFVKPKRNGANVVERGYAARLLKDCAVHAAGPAYAVPEGRTVFHGSREAIIPLHGHRPGRWDDDQGYQNSMVDGPGSIPW